MAIGADVSAPPVDALPANQLRLVPLGPTYADDLLEVLPAHAGVAVVVLLAEHDLATRDVLDAWFSILVVGNDLVVIDLTQVEFLDASTLGTFLRADQAARMKGGRLRLQLPADGIVRRLLEITNLVRLLDCSPTREAALSWPTLTLVRPSDTTPAA